MRNTEYSDLVGAEPFEKGSFPYQDASILIDVRNELVHYEPRWTYYQEQQELSTKTGHAKLEDKLRYRFEPSKMHPASYFAFPHYCLSSSCLEWAFKTSKELAMEFSRKVGIQNMVTLLTGQRSNEQKRRGVVIKVRWFAV